LARYAVDILHGVAAVRESRPRCEARRSSERTARETRRGDRVSEAKIETYFAFSKHAGTKVPGRQTPSRSVDPAEASLDVVKRQAPHLVNGHSFWMAKTREENRERGLAIG
jgi:hypothetical protein